jgi:hypothetical protein
MCGIVGLASQYSNGFSSDEAQALQDMLYVDTLRGWDSTGVFGVDKHASVEIIKEAIPGCDFICSKEFKDIRGKLIKDGLFAVGHNRAATKGAVTDENAHPFWVNDHIILVQNGSMVSDHKKFADVACDSEAIAHLLASEPDIAKALSQVDGGWCFNWFNTKTETLYLIRNNQRPMWFARNKTGALWASEPETLFFAANRNRIKFDEPPKELAAHNLVSMKIKGHGFEITMEQIESWYKPEPHSPKHYGTGTSQTRSRGQYWGGFGGEDLDDEQKSFNELYEQTEQGTWVSKAEAARRREVISSRVHANDIQSPGKVKDIALAYKHDVHHLASPGTTTAMTETRVIMSDYAANHLKEFYVPADKYLRLISLGNDVRLKCNGKIQVEVIDCIPANHNPQCSTWHIYGEMIFPDEIDKDLLDYKILVHWFAYRLTKAQALDHVDKAYYEVDCSAIVSHRYSFPNQTPAYIVKIYGFNQHAYIDSKDANQETLPASSSAA